MPYHQYDDSDIRRFRLFLAAADHGSMNAGAQALDIRRSSVKAAIDLLERRIGTELLLRGPEGVVLTPTGEMVASEARKLLRTSDDHLDQIFRLAGSSAAELRVGSIFGFHSSHIEAINDLVDGYLFTPVALDFLDPAAAVIDGTVGAGLILGPTHHDHLLNRLRIRDESRIVITRGRHLPRPTPESISLTDIDHLEWPALPPVCDATNLGTWLCSDLRGSPPKLTSSVLFELFSLRSWIYGGNRVAATIPSVAAAFTFETGLSAVPLDEPPWPLDLVALRGSDFPLEQVAEHLRSLPDR